MLFLTKLFSRNFLAVNAMLVGAFFGAANLQAENAATGPSPAAQADISQAEAVQNAFRYVADKVQPSVVEINIVEKVQEQKPEPGEQLPWRFFFNNPDANPDQPDQPYSERGLGSGIIVKQDGKTVYVLTNNHVVGAASDITVVTSDEKEYKGTLVGKDAHKDIAIVKFQADDQTFAVATLGNSSSVRVGDWAIAIGSPFGYVSSVTAGIVSAVHRSGGPDGNINDFIQTDASINKGNSGGALVNIHGEVIGMNTWIASQTGGSIGLGFAIPIDNIKKAINDFITKGKVEYGWLGVGLDPIDSATASELGYTSRKAVLASSLYRGSPADKAGIKPGDIILSVNSADIKDVEQLQRIVADLPVGQSASMDVLRAGKRVSLNVTIALRTEGAGTNDSTFFPGLIVRALSSSEIELDKDKVNGVKGVFIASVAEKSPGAVVGLKAQDIVTAVNDKPVTTMQEFYAALNDDSSRKLSFTVNRDGQEITTLAYVKK